MYADDYELFATGNTIEEVKTKLEHDVNIITSWHEDNLCLNLDKFQTMVMDPRDKEKTMNITISENSIEQSTSIKLLVVKVDEQLNFNGRISELCKRTSSRIEVLICLRNLIPEKAKRQIDKAAIFPHLTYCHLSWHFCRASDRRKIERVQERALRVVFIARVLSYEQLYLLLFITRKYTIINANLKLITAKIHSFCSIDIHPRNHLHQGHSITPTDDH